jgi:hypothetical protein
MLPQIAFICVLKPVRQRNKFSTEKHKIFLFQVFDLWFFTKFSSYNSVWIRFRVRIRIRTFFFGFGFGFWSSQKIRIISDSDPQHWNPSPYPNPSNKSLGSESEKNFFGSTTLSRSKGHSHEKSVLNRPMVSHVTVHLSTGNILTFLNVYKFNFVLLFYRSKEEFIFFEKWPYKFCTGTGTA